MPDYNGVLTQPERARIDAWIKNNWHIGNCPVCKKNNWVLADHVVTPILYMGIPGGGFTQGSGYPQIMIMCQVCGYTLYFNTNIVGI
jgi:predicted nucleic-acid-binding Zn-ribbon protein